MNKKIHVLFFTFKIETRVMKKVNFFLLTLTLGYKALHCIYFNSNFLILHISLQNNNLSSDQSGASSSFFFYKVPSSDDCSVYYFLLEGHLLVLFKKSEQT